MQKPSVSRVAERWWKCWRQSVYSGLFAFNSLFFFFLFFFTPFASVRTSTGSHVIGNLSIPRCPPEHLRCAQPPFVISPYMWWCQQLFSRTPPMATRTHHRYKRFSALPEVTPTPPAPSPAPFLHFYIFEMMDNDVVALFSLLRQTRSHIDCSFSQKAVVWGQEFIREKKII